jgi:glycosyltransferase involved in cell wall biosynthesis
LKAFNTLMTKGKEFKLIIGGSGWNNRDVSDFIIKNNLKNKIIITGFIPKNEVVDLLNTAEVFIFPSYFEGFGIPNLEAMACGCPVITSRAFAIPEVVRDAALLLQNKEDANELADKILQIIENKDLKNNLVNKGFERVKSFSWEESAKTVLNIYERCLNN